MKFYNKLYLLFICTLSLHALDAVTVNEFKSAAASGELEVVKEFLQEKASSPDIQNYYKDIGLAFAVRFGKNLDNKPVIEYFINNGADINASLEEPTLIRAAEKGNIDLLNYFLSIPNVDIDITTEHTHDTALHTALYRLLDKQDPVYLDVLKILLDKKADRTIKDTKGSAPVHYAITYPTAKNSNVANNAALLLLGNNSPDSLNIQDAEGNSPLHIAIKKSNKPLFNYLVLANADLNLKNKKGYPPLHIAIYKRDSSMIDGLLDKGANVNIQDDQGETPLHLAVFGKAPELVEKLLSLGAKLDVKNNSNQTPLELAQQLVQVAAGLKTEEQLKKDPAYLTAQEIIKILQDAQPAQQEELKADTLGIFTQKLSPLAYK